MACATQCKVPALGVCVGSEAGPFALRFPKGPGMGREDNPGNWCDFRFEETTILQPRTSESPRTNMSGKFTGGKWGNPTPSSRESILGEFVSDNGLRRGTVTALTNLLLFQLAQSQPIKPPGLRST